MLLRILDWVSNKKGKLGNSLDKGDKGSNAPLVCPRCEAEIKDATEVRCPRCYNLLVTHQCVGCGKCKK